MIWLGVALMWMGGFISGILLGVQFRDSILGAINKLPKIKIIIKLRED